MLHLPFSLDEIARLGDALYERDVLPRVTDADLGHIVAIDVESGAFAIDPDQLTAGDRVLARHPDAVLWFRRVGADYVHRFGGRSLTQVLQGHALRIDAVPNGRVTISSLGG
jgi:hypothetical protein